MYRGAACFACKQLFEWQNISQQQDISTKHQHQRSISFKKREPNIFDLFRSFELACQCMEMLNRRLYHIHSHQHCPSSVLRLCALQSVSGCFALQIVQSASLHNFKLVFLISAGN